jgi:hypothetical protein
LAKPLTIFPAQDVEEEDDYSPDPVLDHPINPLTIKPESLIRTSDIPIGLTGLPEKLWAHDQGVDVVALAKVDVPTYTKRLIDELKQHEDEYKKKQLEELRDDAEFEGKGPYRQPSYQVTKGALDPDIMPDEGVILKSRMEDIENYTHKVDLKKRRSIELDQLQKQTDKFKE